MKFFETTFDEYENAVLKTNLHPKIEKNVFSKFPDKIEDLRNVIFYGPPGVGKYSQSLHCLKKYSPSELKYVKKLPLTYNKRDYFFRISDIHYEVDMSVLGCNSKLLWHEIYQKIVDVVSAKTEKHGIILCKNFNETHSELLENFYIYMQNNIHEKHIHIVFFLINEHISFLPDNIINCCHIVHFPRPAASSYKKCVATKKLPPTNEITNIKNLHATHIPMNNHSQMLQNIVDYIIKIENFDLMVLREHLYDFLVYNIDINEVVWFVFNNLVSNGHINTEDITPMLFHTYEFFKYYNNNYRPIYHLEHYVLTLVKIIHKDKMTKDIT